MSLYAIDPISFFSACMCDRQDLNMVWLLTKDADVWKADNSSILKIKMDSRESCRIRLDLIKRPERALLNLPATSKDLGRYQSSTSSISIAASRQKRIIDLVYFPSCVLLLPMGFLAKGRWLYVPILAGRRDHLQKS